MSGLLGSRPAPYYGWYIVVVCVFLALVTIGVRGSFGVFIIPMSQDFGWSRTSISLAAILGILVNGATQPFLGSVYDRFGGRKVLLAGLLVLGVSTILLSFTRDILFIPAILFLAFMSGFVVGTAASAVSLTNMGALLSRWFSRRRATVIGCTAAGASAGGMLLVPFAAYFLQATDWRMTWVALGVIPLVLALPLAWFFLRDDPSELGLHPDGDPEPIQEDSADNAISQGGPLEVERWADAFRSPPIWQVSLAYAICGATTFILTFHFVPFAIEREISPGRAATMFGLMSGLNVVGSIGAGVLSDKFGRKNLLALVYLLRGGGYLLLLLAPSELGLWGFAVVAGFSWWATAPLTATLTADVYGLRALGTISGVTFVFHQVGGAATVLLAGFLHDLTGSYTLPFALTGTLLLPAALLAFTVQERRYSTRYQQPAPSGAAAGS
jgi:sugar phosphate permease